MIKTAFAAGVAALAFTAVPAQADVLALSGSIDYQCDLTLAGEGASTINLKSGQNPLGSFRVICNDPDGFQMTITSANNGNLNSGPYNVNYKLKSTAQDGETELAFGDTALGAPIVKGAAGFDVGHADVDGAGYALQMQIGGGQTTLPGGLALTDTLTFTLTGI